MVETGEQICEVPCSTPTFTVAWHPKENVLAFACDDKVSIFAYSLHFMMKFYERFYAHTKFFVFENLFLF